MNVITKKGSNHGRPSEMSITKIDDIAVKLSSLFIVGSVVWGPSLFIYLYKKWKNTPKEDTKKRSFYRNLFISLSLCAILGPHRHPKVGQWVKARHWNLWNAWLRYLSFEVITEDSPNNDFNLKNDQAILAFSPHGIVPFSLGFAALPQAATDHFGSFRVVVATATRVFPLVRTIIEWLFHVDASRSAVDQALAQGDRIGLAPGGISEMFEGYPKAGRHPDEECVMLNSRKGFIRMALKHKVPLIPIYTFGSSKLLKRLQIPVLEKFSNWMRVSLCVFYGVCGLPIPFRTKLLYVVGAPIHPPSNIPEIGTPEFNQQVDDMHLEFCEAMTRLFDKYKSNYGWDHKTLRIV